MSTTLTVGEEVELVELGELTWIRPYQVEDGSPALEVADLKDRVAIRYFDPRVPADEIVVTIVPARNFAKFIGAAHFGGQYNDFLHRR